MKLSGGVFLLITIFYGIIKYFMVSYNFPLNNKLSISLLLFYSLIVTAVQVQFNIMNSKALCKGSAQIINSAIYTIIPFLLIFVVTGFFINSYPGWLQPFSNTIGYIILKIFYKLDWLSDLATRKDDKVLIKKDNSLFLNELTPTNFKSVMGKMLYYKLINLGENKDLGESSVPNSGAPITKPNSGYKPMVGGKRKRKRKQKGGDGSKTLASMSLDEREAMEKKLKNIGINCGYGYEGESTSEADERIRYCNDNITKYLKAEKEGTLDNFIEKIKKEKASRNSRNSSQPAIGNRYAAPPIPSAPPIQSAPSIPSAPPIPSAQPLPQEQHVILMKEPSTSGKTSGKGGGSDEVDIDKKMDKAIKANMKNEIFLKLWRFVNFKNIISEVTWFLLCGTLAIGFSYNSVLNISCSHSLEQQEVLNKKSDEKIDSLNDNKSELF